MFSPMEDLVVVTLERHHACTRVQGYKELADTMLDHSAYITPYNLFRNMVKLRVPQEPELELRSDGIHKLDSKEKSTSESSEEVFEPRDEESHEEVHKAAPTTLAALLASLPRCFAAVEERLGGVETIILDICKQVKAQDLAVKGVATGQTLIAESVTEAVSPPRPKWGVPQWHFRKAVSTFCRDEYVTSPSMRKVGRARAFDCWQSRWREGQS
jgi:hypothetical protein